jgi:predicted MPP superfamily phosphohydrolase
MANLRDSLKGPVYGVLGNHDTIAMVPGLEAMGIRMLLNEKDVLERGRQRIHLAGIDDAHFYQVDNIEKAAAGNPHNEFAILISHTPEIYRHAAHAGFDVLISGHTHGGQICLPGGTPLTLDSNLPRRMGSGSWKYHDMIGYTSRGAGSSVVPVRFNCPPEITLHHFQSEACEPHAAPQKAGEQIAKHGRRRHQSSNPPAKSNQWSEGGRGQDREGEAPQRLRRPQQRFAIS